MKTQQLKKQTSDHQELSTRCPIQSVSFYSLFLIQLRTVYIRENIHSGDVKLETISLDTLVSLCSNMYEYTVADPGFPVGGLDLVGGGEARRCVVYWFVNVFALADLGARPPRVPILSF